MKVLMISGDPAVFEANSGAGKRTEWYREALGEVDILLCRGNIFNFFAGFLHGMEKIVRNKPDVISAQDMEHSFLAWLFSKIYGIPWQMQVHTDILDPYFARQSFKNKIRVRLAKFLLPKADGIRVVSERIKKSLIEYDKTISERIIVLPIFVSAEYIRAYTVKTDLRKKYPGRFVILMASRITKEKNITMAVEAMKDLSTHPKDPLLLIVGDGPELPRLKKISKNEIIKRNIIFLPFTDDVISYYKTCSLFLLTSNYEGYGMTLAEASAAGTKIISTDVGIASEILPAENIIPVNGKTALVARIFDAMEGVIGDPKEPEFQTKGGYLRLYKESLEKCLNKK